METLIIQPTPLAEWQSLIEDAERSSSIKLPEEIECYLVFLLMRFSDRPQLVHSILATDFLQSLAALPKERLDILKEVGDKCLLFAGLFPGRARKKRVRISYFVRLGQMAYDSISLARSSRNQSADPNQSNTLYRDLAYHFVGLMDILHTMRELEMPNPAFLDLLQAEELWHDTQSPHALKTLKDKTQGFVPLIFPSSSFQKH